MLYQSLVFDYPAVLFQNTLPSGVLGLVAMTVPSNGYLKLAMNQMMPDPLHTKQDRSIQAWVSTSQGGNPVVDLPINVSRWHLTALQRSIMYLYDASDPSLGVFDAPSIGLTPGPYWLNVLNLVNETNSFHLEIKTGP